MPKNDRLPASNDDALREIILLYGFGVGRNASVRSIQMKPSSDVYPRLSGRVCSSINAGSG